jgi:diguanylate cyclase (GGDEF)-like protein
MSNGSPIDDAIRILVVDDDPQTARLVRSWFEGKPFVVLEASDGEKGVELARSEQPDVILLDVVMPGLDGLAVAGRLKTDPATMSIPVIMLTAQRTLKNKVEGLDSGADDYVTKPFEFEEVDARIRAMLRVRDLQDRLEETVEELEDKNRLLNELAVVDEKTGLFNYRHFREKLEQEWLRAERYGTPLSLVMLDLDDFKQLNDTLGHQAGDQALREFATLVTGGARATDISARYGGEEFVVLLPHTDGDRARGVSERIRDAARQFVFVEDEHPSRMTVSAGVATYPSTGIDSADTLVRRADEALYRAKETGKDRVIVAGNDKSGPKSSVLRGRGKPSQATGTH